VGRRSARSPSRSRCRGRRRHTADVHPGIGDYTNAKGPRGPKQQVIARSSSQQTIGTGGNVPWGAALSVILMVGTLVIVLPNQEGPHEELV